MASPEPKALENKTLIPVFVIVVFIIGFALLQTDNEELRTGGRAVAFETVHAGVESAYPEQSNFIIKNDKELQELWQLIYRDRSVRPPQPDVDFSQHKLLVVFQGKQPNGGYDISIKEVIDKGEKIEVVIQERRPARLCKAEIEPSAPYYIAKIPQTDKEITSRREVKIVPCDEL